MPSTVELVFSLCLIEMVKSAKSIRAKVKGDHSVGIITEHPLGCSS